MTVEPSLLELLSAGERAAFHAAPGSAVPLLESAVTLATRQSRPAEAAAASWLLGVALAASGRYGAALAVLQPVLHPGERGGQVPEVLVFGALAGATVASIHRQLGRHDAAAAYDGRGLALAAGSAEAAFDCRLGLAADAVGVGAAATAATELARAAALVPAGEQWWRQRVRLDWVRAEVALLGERADAAVQAARSALDRAAAAHAPRHVAKSLLFLGVAQLQVSDPTAVETLQRAAVLAESLGTVPLVWPARAVLGAHLAGGDPPGSAKHLAAARTAVAAIAAELPVELRTQWLARPDIAELLDT